MSEAENLPTPLLIPAGGTPDLIVGESELAQAIKEMKTLTGPIAIDAERASGYRYSARAYLIQIKRERQIYLIDPIPFSNPDTDKASTLISELNQLIQSEEVIIHAASQDLACLRDFGLFPKRLFDTELGARLAGLPKVGLGPLCEHFFNISLAKEHSAVDWSIRPLHDDWLTYAALDVELLIEIREQLIASLSASGKLEWAYAEFQNLLDAPPAPPREDPWRRTSGMHKVRKREQLAIVRELWGVRDQIAASQDIAPGRLLSDNAITELAVADPKLATSVKGLSKILRPIGMRSRWLDNASAWIDAIAKAQQAELPLMRLNGDGMPPVKQWREKFPERYAPLTHAKAAVNQRALELNLPAENLITPEFVRRICWDQTAPDLKTIESKLAKLGARPWQINEVAALLAAALTQSEPLVTASEEPAESEQ